MNYFIEKPIPFYEQIYNSIKQMIIRGVFKPGERIYEAKLAREFAVSRSPVREAVHALVKEGLLIMDEKSKITVYQPTVKDVKDIYQCRAVLESLATRLTTELASDGELKNIESTLVQTKKLLSTAQEKPDENIVELNAKFHELIVQYCQNHRLQKLLNDLRSLLHYFRFLNFQGENRPQTILDEHMAIFEAIKKRDAENAARLMADHIRHDLEHLLLIIGGE